MYRRQRVSTYTEETNRQAGHVAILDSSQLTVSVRTSTCEDCWSVDIHQCHSSQSSLFAVVALTTSLSHSLALASAQLALSPYLHTPTHTAISKSQNETFLPLPMMAY